MTNVRTDFPFPVEVIENVFVPLPDGTRLAAKLWRPKGAVPVPAILEYLPYRKRDGTRYRDQGMHAYLAGHGYACVRLDIRGSGDSEGLIDDEYTVQEQLDGCDAIAWLAAQDWCDGQVAMIGISWGGFNGLQIAARQPAALKTIITVGSTDDRYATDIHWVGGCLSKDNFDWSATMMATNDLPPDPDVVGDRWRTMWQARMAHQRPWITDWLRHQRRDDFWKQGSVCEDFSAIKVPVYAVSGWADNYSESVPRLLAGLDVPRRGLIGPWAHSYPHDVTVEPAIGWLQEVVRWCDQWMKGRDTGIMQEPMYRVWMQDSVPPATCYRTRPGRWVAEDCWPSPRITTHRMPLGADGRFSDIAGTRSICSPLWVGMNSGEVGRYGDDADWPGDQREDDGGSLVFLSDPLPEAIEILGAPQIALRFSCDKAFALIAARLNDVRPDGSATRVGVGILNLTHRDSHEYPTPLEPGQDYDAVVEMDDIAHHFPAGHRIAVALSTVYYPMVWPSPELVTLTVHCGASALHLPIRPPRPEDDRLRPFDPPEEAAQTPVVHHASPATNRRRITRDLLNGKIVVDFPRWTYAMEMTDIEQTQISTGTCRHEITEGDPLSAATYTDNRVEIRRKDTTILHHSTGSLTCDATHFIVQMQVRLSENGQEVFARDWHDRIPRDIN
ncbi:CocE/NonD family hydrolase [Roseicyclus sp.]|uniref:CocE/NonD family hydrolase n=1 Tax=Roseicyclus sp. TaxID=1914329 RepID=UPI001BCDA7B3|nr:CocE/NonD family hydrolase [Roseicyclus sp.]